MWTNSWRSLKLSISTIAAPGLMLLIIAGPNSAQSDSLDLTSPNRNYAVRFSEPRSDVADSGRLWGKITVRDLKTGRERAGRVAKGERGGDIFEGFSQYEVRPAWSPDGLYLAYWVNSCKAESAVPGGVVCHLHELHFLSMQENECREELVLARYEFAGWAEKEPHTILEIPAYADSRTDRRSPCIRK